MIVMYNADNESFDELPIREYKCQACKLYSWYYSLEIFDKLLLSLAFSKTVDSSVSRLAEQGCLRFWFPRLRLHNAEKMATKTQKWI